MKKIRLSTSNILDLFVQYKYDEEKTETNLLKPYNNKLQAWIFKSSVIKKSKLFSGYQRWWFWIMEALKEDQLYNVEKFMMIIVLQIEIWNFFKPKLNADVLKIMWFGTPGGQKFWEVFVRIKILKIYYWYLISI